MRKLLLSTIALWSLELRPVSSQEVTADSINWYEMDLQTLMKIEVTTASKKAQNIDQTPAAIFVITKEDLKFYGFNNVGEALKLVPGIEFNQGADHNYEIGIRGFSRSEYNTSNKILWLIDGRSVYNDAFGGVRMESLPISMDDIERIEVIRGPGSSLYGANAYSGIINIITKKPKDQKGAQVTAAYGNLNQVHSNIRYGQRSEKFSYKAVMGFDNLDKPSLPWSKLSDDSIASLKDAGYAERDLNAYKVLYGNVAMNYNLGEKTVLDFSGGIADNKADHYFVFPGSVSYRDYFLKTGISNDKNNFRIYFNGTGTDDGYRINRFSKRVVPDGTDSVNDAYLTAHGRQKLVGLNGINVTNKLVDAEYQRTLKVGEKLTGILGGSYRRNFVTGNLFSQDGEFTSYQNGFAALFANLEYRIQKFNFILGGRYDNHSLVGNNFNPRVALVYSINEKQNLRINYGTATRNPHFLDSYLNTYMRVANLKKLTGLDPVKNLTTESDYVHFNINGSSKITAEKISYYELGYNISVGKSFQGKLDIFYGKSEKPIEFLAEKITIERVDKLENLSSIIQKSSGNTSFDMKTTGEKLGVNWTEDMTKEELNAAKNAVTAAKYTFKTDSIPATNYYIGIYDSIRPNPDSLVFYQNKKAGFKYMVDSLLTPLEGGFSKLLGAYSAPKILHLGPENADKTQTFYGYELGFTFIPLKNLTIMLNYGYLKFTSGSTIELKLSDPKDKYKGVDQFLKIIASPEHKINMGVKYRFKNKMYAGIMFNYMSEMKFASDNDYDATYTVNDRDDYPNKGITTIDDRFNLNANVGFEIKKFEIYVTGFNLIQPDYHQIPVSYATDRGDPLNRRYMAGVKFTF